MGDTRTLAGEPPKANEDTLVLTQPSPRFTSWLVEHDIQHLCATLAAEGFTSDADLRDLKSIGECRAAIPALKGECVHVRNDTAVDIALVGSEAVKVMRATWGGDIEMAPAYRTPPPEPKIAHAPPSAMEFSAIMTPEPSPEVAPEVAPEDAREDAPATANCHAAGYISGDPSSD